MTVATSKFKKVALEESALVDALREKFGDDIVTLDVHERRGGKNDEVQSRDLWIEISRNAFRPFVEHLFDYDFVNFHVVSGDDVGESIVLNYHFSLFQRTRRGRIGVSLSIHVPKNDLSLPSLFDLLPGTEYSEREMREMFGIDFQGLPNKALVFLPENWNEEIKPWRRDETGPAPEIVRDLQ